MKKLPKRLDFQGFVFVFLFLFLQTAALYIARIQMKREQKISTRVLWKIWKHFPWNLFTRVNPLMLKSAPDFQTAGGAGEEKWEREGAVASKNVQPAGGEQESGSGQSQPDCWCEDGEDWAGALQTSKQVPNGLLLLDPLTPELKEECISESINAQRNINTALVHLCGKSGSYGIAFRFGKWVEQNIFYPFFSCRFYTLHISGGAISHIEHIRISSTIIFDHYYCQVMAPSNFLPKVVLAKNDSFLPKAVICLTFHSVIWVVQ